MLTIDRIKALKLIILFALLNGFVFLAFRPQGFSILRIFAAYMLLMSVALLITFYIRIEDRDFMVNPYFKFLFFLLFLWICFTIFRSVSSSSKDMISLFGHYLMAWAWITPLTMIFGLNIFNWIYIFDYLGKMLLIGIILFPLLFITSSEDMGFGIEQFLFIFPILLLTSKYQKSSYKKIIFFAILAFIIVSIFISQRINALLISMSIIFFAIEVLKNKDVDAITKLFIYVLISLAVLMLSVESINIYKDATKDKELTTDTRTFLITELYQDMSDTELIAGRGALGTYYSPYFASTKSSGISGGDSPIRSVSEIGYLEMVLKGGYIMMVLYLLILIPAAFLGIFKSNNTIARMCGYIIFMYILIWIISYPPVYSAQFILLWMAAGTAISPIARNMTDEELLKFKEDYENANQR